jgi:uncharacterized protein (TIGR03790 family)
MTIKEKVEINWLEKRKHELENQLNNTNGEKRGPRESIKKELDSVKRKIVALRKDDKWASLDSEIVLVLEKNYPLSGWILNPYFLGFKDRTFSIKRENVLMVSRLDGPKIKTVKRIIDDSLKTEEK